MTEIPNKNWFRPDELEKLIPLREKAIRKLMKQGEIKSVCFGPRKTFIPREEVERLVHSGR